MDKPPAFDPTRINDLISAINNGQAVSHVSNDLPESVSNTIASNTSLLDNRQPVQIHNAEDIYRELSNLINVSYELLHLAQYALQTNPEGEGVITGISSLVNSIRDLLREFIKVQATSIKFEQMKEMERLKTECKKELLAMKINAAGGPVTNGATIPMYEYNQEKIISSILEKEKKILNILDQEKACPQLPSDNSVVDVEPNSPPSQDVH